MGLPLISKHSIPQTQKNRPNKTEAVLLFMPAIMPISNKHSVGIGTAPKTESDTTY